MSPLQDHNGHAVLETQYTTSLERKYRLFYPHILTSDVVYTSYKARKSKSERKKLILDEIGQN